MWVNIQRIIGVAHCANVVWPDLAYAEEGGERGAISPFFPEPVEYLIGIGGRAVLEL